MPAPHGYRRKSALENLHPAAFAPPPSLLRQGGNVIQDESEEWLEEVKMAYRTDPFTAVVAFGRGEDSLFLGNALGVTAPERRRGTNSNLI